MSKFKIFNKKSQLENVEPNTEISIPVRDLKTHMVNEFERARELVNDLKIKNTMIEQYRENELKHNAALVLVDEYKKRIDYQAEEISTLQRKYDEQIKLRRSIEEDKNTLIIHKDIMQEKIDNNDINNELVFKDRIDQFCINLLEEVDSSLSVVKGNVSKIKFQELLIDAIQDVKTRERLNEQV